MLFLGMCKEQPRAGACMGGCGSVDAVGSQLFPSPRAILTQGTCLPEGLCPILLAASSKERLMWGDKNLASVKDPSEGTFPSQSPF